MERENLLLKICELITDSDSEVLAEIEACIENIEGYIATHLEEYEERCMNLENDSEEDLQWIGMVNCLIRNNYAVEFSWDTTITEFGWGIKSLRSFKQLRLDLDRKFLDDDSGIDSYDVDSDDEDVFDYQDEEDIIEGEDIEGWSRYIDNKWADEDICLAMIGGNEESYVIFIIETEVLEEIADLADSINRHISTVY